MKCYVFRDLLPEYSENLCSRETVADMEAHLQTCEVCRKHAEEMKSEEFAAERIKDRQTGQPEDIENEIIEKEIQPFKKVKQSFRKKTRKLKAGILILAVICIALGVLTVGQIWPQTQFPNFDRLIIRHRAKQVGICFAEGNMEQLLNDMLDMAELNDVLNVYNRDSGKALYDNVKENLDLLHEKYVGDGAVKVYVQNIIYEKQDFNHSIYQNPEMEDEGVSAYSCEVMVETQEMVFHLNLSYMTNQYYLFSNMEAVPKLKDQMADDSTANTMQRAEACLQIESWLEYFRNSLSQGDMNPYVIELVMKTDREYPANTYQQFVGRYFSQDCMVPEEKDGDGFTEYGKQLGEKLKILIDQTDTVDFTIKNKGYDAAENKGKAMLFWSFTDGKGQYVNMTKALYYGPYGYQAVDDSEIICCDGVLDTGLRQSLEKVFD